MPAALSPELDLCSAVDPDPATQARLEQLNE